MSVDKQRNTRKAKNEQFRNTRGNHRIHAPAKESRQATDEGCQQTGKQAET